MDIETLSAELRAVLDDVNYLQQTLSNINVDGIEDEIDSIDDHINWAGHHLKMAKTELDEIS